VGGWTAAPDTAPWLAFISVAGNACTGSVVAPNVVLTAGHCTEDEASGHVFAPAEYRVQTGTQELGYGAQISAVSRVIVDPNWNTRSGQSDAALLVLSTPTTAPPVALATPGDGLAAPGTPAVVDGWGLTDPHDSSSIPLDAQQADTVVQANGYCGSRLWLNDSPFDATTELCAVDAPYYHESTCPGDSGGPLLANDREGRPGTVTEIGIVVQGPAGCEGSEPDLFTRVSAISPWANRWISALHPPSPPPARASNPPASSRYRVPVLYQRTLARAKAMLAARHLKLGVVRRVRGSGARIGSILRASPRGGTWQNAGTRVSVWVRSR
jgi:V8-like Glu-specific endopeptidase